MGKCRFKPTWLTLKDKNGYFVREWAKKHDEEHVFCMVCCKPFSISAGFEQIEKHARGDTHKRQCSVKLASSQMRLAAVRPGSADVSVDEVPPSVLQVYGPRDKIAMAELRWVMKCVVADWSARSCDGIGDLFTAMFGEEAVRDFSLSATKFRYLLTEALGPFMRQQFLTDVAGSFYTLSFDETTNNANAKELQDNVTYWSETKKMVEHHHLQTFFIGSATGKVIVGKHIDAIDGAGLPLVKLLMVGRDGPNVNKTVQRLMNEEVLKVRDKPLLDIGSCNIHILHNGFEKGVKVLGEDASELIIAVHKFFDGWPLREEDFENIQKELGLPVHSFIKHVLSRWLTMENAALRLLEQWEAVNNYFLKFVPRKRTDLLKSSSYKKIVEYLKQDDTQ